MGSYKSGYNFLNRSNYSYPTYNPTYHYPRTSKYTLSYDVGKPTDSVCRAFSGSFSQALSARAWMIYCSLALPARLIRFSYACQYSTPPVKAFSVRSGITLPHCFISLKSFYTLYFPSLSSRTALNPKLQTRSCR